MLCYHFYMKQAPHKNKHFTLTSIWFWWLLLTVLYSALSIIFHVPAIDHYPHGAGFIGYVIGFIGLFVPYGPLSIFYFLVSPLSWVSFAFFLYAMFYAEKKLGKAGLTPWKRILMNIFALLLITTMVDIIRPTPFESWQIFLNAGWIQSGW